LDDDTYGDEEHEWDDVTEDGLDEEFIDDNYSRVYHPAIIDPLVSLDPQPDTTVTHTPALSDPTLSQSNQDNEDMDSLLTIEELVETDSEPEEEDTTPPHRYNLRPSRDRSYDHCFDH
jgi:hypothetical protein